MSVIGNSQSHTCFLPAEILEKGYADFFDDFAYSYKRLEPSCCVTGIPYCQFEAIGMARKLPPPSSVEFSSFRVKYELDEVPHPFFFTCMVAKNDGVKREVGRLDTQNEFHRGLASKRILNPNGSVLTAAEIGIDAAGSDESLWLWWGVSTRQQRERFQQTYGWMASAPTATNFSCLLHDSLSGTSDRISWMSDPFVVYW